MKGVKKVDSLIEEIRILCNKTVNKYRNETSYFIHTRMQKTILYWAQKNHYEAETEYEVESRGDDSDHNGRIDLRLVANGKVYLIEFDTTNKRKSIYKLLNTPADFRLWIRSINDALIFFYYFHDIDVGDIIVVPVMNWDDETKKKK